MIRLKQRTSELHDMIATWVNVMCVFNTTFLPGVETLTLTGVNSPRRQVGV